MTSLQPVVSEAELTLYLLVLIAVLSLITTVVVLASGVRSWLDRRVCRLRRSGLVGFGDEVPPGYSSPPISSGARGRQVARDPAGPRAGRGSS